MNPYRLAMLTVLAFVCGEITADILNTAGASVLVTIITKVMATAAVAALGWYLAKRWARR